MKFGTDKSEGDTQSTQENEDSQPTEAETFRKV